MIGKFFHVPKPKKFSIPNRYYDPEKEEREEREKRIREELGIPVPKDPEKPYVPNIRGKFRMAAEMNAKISSDDRRKSNSRLIGLILLLVLIIYLFFFSNLFS